MLSHQKVSYVLIKTAMEADLVGQQRLEEERKRKERLDAGKAGVKRAAETATEDIDPQVPGADRHAGAGWRSGTEDAGPSTASGSGVKRQAEVSVDDARAVEATDKMTDAVILTMLT